MFINNSAKDWWILAEICICLPSLASFFLTFHSTSQNIPIKSRQNDRKMVQHSPKWSKQASKWGQNDTERCQNDPQVTPKWPQIDPKVVQSWCQIVTFSSQNGPFMEQKGKKKHKKNKKISTMIFDTFWPLFGPFLVGFLASFFFLTSGFNTLHNIRSTVQKGFLENHRDCMFPPEAHRLSYKSTKENIK